MTHGRINIKLELSKFSAKQEVESSTTIPDRTLFCAQGRQLQQWDGLFSLVFPAAPI